MFYGGEVVGQSAIKHMEEVGMEVTHKYVVDNRGPWRVDEAKVAILWPYQVENNKEQGKWLLYMTEVPSVDGKSHWLFFFPFFLFFLHSFLHVLTYLFVFFY